MLLNRRAFSSLQQRASTFGGHTLQAFLPARAPERQPDPAEQLAALGELHDQMTNVQNAAKGMAAIAKVAAMRPNSALLTACSMAADGYRELAAGDREKAGRKLAEAQAAFAAATTARVPSPKPKQSPQPAPAGRGGPSAFARNMRAEVLNRLGDSAAGRVW